jgi:hypothetical protein
MMSGPCPLSLSVQNPEKPCKTRSSNGKGFGTLRRALSALILLTPAAALAASVSPTSLSWASVSVGGIGGQKVATLTNNGTSAITISSETLSGANAGDFRIFSKTCGSSLSVGASCTANITFNPSASGTRTATLDFNDSVAPSPQTIALSGYAPGSTSGGSATVSPSSLSWASVAVGGIGGQKTAVLKNSGTSSITISSVTLAGANPGDFRIFSKTCGSSLAAGASCSANVTFNPTVGGTRTATLNFNDSATGSPQVVTLSGYAPGGSSGTVSISPTSLSFGSINVGSTSGAQTTTLKNGSSSTISISGISVGGADPGDFVISSKTCGSSLAASASCSVSIAFKPSATGTRTATLAVSDTGSGSPQTVALSGTGGSTSGGSATASPTSLSWASVAVGGIGGQKTAVLKNSGTSSITISSVTLAGANPGDFRIFSQTCGSSLAAGASCSANVTFNPTTGGTRTATLNFNDSATGSPQMVALSGYAPGGSTTVSISPTSLSFGSLGVGSTSGSLTTTLSNGTSSAITINSVSLTGANPGDFIISSKTCGSSLAASANCSISVSFKPSASGTRTATLTVADSASDSPQTVALSGTGGTSSGGSVTVSPTSLGFPSTAVGSTSSAQSATLKNGTSSTISISSIAIGGTNAGDFAISGKTCGTSLTTLASCTASVVFKPTVGGTRTATLTFADSGSGSPQTVALSGSTPGAFEIEPVNPTVVVNQALQFSATIDVTWSASCGSITSTSGIYTAPSSTGTCTVTATKIGGSHATVSTSVKVTGSPSSGTLQIYPTSAAVFAGTQQIYQAQLSTVPDGHSLTYSVDGVVGGNSTTGTITNEGVYTAPSVAGKHTITVKDNSLGKSVSGSATVYKNVSVDFASRSTSLHQIPAHLFGTERMDSLRNTADLDLVKAGGISYARFYALIPSVFATQTPNWGPIDAAVQRISAGGVKIMLQMYQTPPWLQPSPNPCGSGDPNVPPADYTKWGKMAAQYIQHMDTKFPGVVTDYEIWNEPDTAALCTAASNRESVYLALYKAAVPIMRAQVKTDGSSARVGGPATAGLPAAWVNAMLSDSVISQNIDFLSYHIYPFSNTQLGAQWDTYNGVISVLQSTQNSGLGPLDYYLNATHLVANGKQPQGKNLPIYNSEYNINWDFAKTCCQNDPTYSPVWNALFVAGGLNAVYSGAPNVMQHMVYFAATAHPYFCLIGEINANMDCTYPTNPVPYPQYYLYQLFGSTNYLGLQNGGYMANSIAPGYLGNGLVTTAFYTTNLDAIVLINPTGETLNNVPITIPNSGLSSASATLYRIDNGQSIQSSSLSLQSTSGTSYTTTVTMDPYSVQAISIHH